MDADHVTKDSPPNSRRSAAVAWFLLMFAWPLTPCVASAPLQLELLLSDQGEVYRELAGAFQAELGLACSHRCPSTPSVRVSTVDDWRPDARRDLLVAVGNKAALHGLVNHPRGLVYGLIPKATWHSLEQLHPSEPGAASAVYLDQPLSRQFDLLALTLPPDRRRIGVLLGPSSARTLPALRESAERLGMTLVTRQLQRQEQVGPAMEELAGQIDLLLAVPDPMVFNRDTLYGILLTSYGAGVAVAGYSEALVQAGAMIALYTSVPNMARQLARISADHLLDGGDLPAPGPSQYFEIAVNRNVARSLGYDLPDTAELNARLASMGGGNGAAQAAQ